MLVRNRFKLFGIISVIDIIMLAVLIFFVAMVIRFSEKKQVSAADGSGNVRYTVEIQRRENGYSDNIRPGEKVYDTLKGSEIGVVSEVYTQKYKVDAPDFSINEYKRPEVDGYYNVYVVIEAPGTVTSQATTVGDYEIMVGKEAYIRAKSFSGGGYIINLEK